MAKDKAIENALNQIFTGIRGLQFAHPGKQFTIDGRLVGDLGEMFAELHYDLTIDEIQQERHDGTTSGGTRVQVKATFKDSLTFRKPPELYLGLKLHEDGSFEEVFNGPPDIICAEYGHRKGFKTELLSFPIKRLRELSSQISESKRVPRRRGA
jgi:hypothetical protein